MSPEYLTKAGHKKLQKELDYLRDDKRIEMAKSLREAAENSIGEFVEDPEFEAAKNAQAFVEGRIRELELLLVNVEIITKKRKKNGVVEIGSKVVIREGQQAPEEYIIVGQAEANPRNGMISQESPLGSALLEHKAGDNIEVEAPSGNFTVRLVKVN